MTKLLLLSTALSLALTGIASAQGDAISREDKEFLKNAAEINSTEVASGQLAQEKGGPEVQKVGKMLVEDHSKANEELMALAKKKNVELTIEPNAAQKKMMTALEKKTGAEFDKEFHKLQEKSHKMAIRAFEDAAKDSKDPDVKAYATKQLPGLQKHLHAVSGEGHDEKKKD
jgi:putative membrane protein